MIIGRHRSQTGHSYFTERGGLKRRKTSHHDSPQPASIFHQPSPQKSQQQQQQQQPSSILENFNLDPDQISFTRITKSSRASPDQPRQRERRIPEKDISLTARLHRHSSPTSPASPSSCSSSSSSSASSGPNGAAPSSPASPATATTSSTTSCKNPPIVINLFSSSAPLVPVSSATSTTSTGPTASSSSKLGFISDEVTLIPKSSSKHQASSEEAHLQNEFVVCETSEDDGPDDATRPLRRDSPSLLNPLYKHFDSLVIPESPERDPLALDEDRPETPELDSANKPAKTTPTILSKSRLSKTQLRLEKALGFLNKGTTTTTTGDHEEEKANFKRPVLPDSQEISTSSFYSSKRPRFASNSVEHEPLTSFSDFDGVADGDPGSFIDEELEHYRLAAVAADDDDVFVSPATAHQHRQDHHLPYYSMGFPNPLGENRCWLNATLHAIFALPVLSKLADINFTDCSRLLAALIGIQVSWRKFDKSTVYSNIVKLKEELKVLDESYPSDCQQDVSEFLTIFFNYIRTDFEKLLAPSKDDDNEIENVPSNKQDSVKRLQNSSTSECNKRPPLADISASAGQQGNQIVPSSSQSQCSTKCTTESQSAEGSSNPVDEYFSLYMIESYTCEGCKKQRQQKIANLMLFVDLPTQDLGTINLTDSIDKTFAPETRNLTCETCKHQVHSMSTKFTKFPKILMVQVKRYEMNGDGEINKKCTSVNIPKSLKLDSSMILNSQSDEQSAEYEPIAIISHVGGSMDCGHYTSYVKYGEKWYYYNDLDVREMSTEQALKSAQRTAYLVFFKDVTLDDTI